MDMHELKNITCKHCKKGNIFKFDRRALHTVLAMEESKDKLKVTVKKTPVFDVPPLTHEGFVYCVACGAEYAKYSSKSDKVEIIFQE